MSSPSITFVNHASVLVRGREKAVLSDPWYSGDAFHKGWRLLYENTDAEIEQVLAQTSHIWLSHEHPDHFSVGFFKKYKSQLLRSDIPILFQVTKDKRVERFLEKEGFRTIILAADQPYVLEDGFTVRIAPDEFYDSALILDVGGTRIFNLNDCTIHGPQRIAAFRKRHGTCDVLLTQFSYAAWKGGRDNVAWRRRAASEKLASVVAQAEGFGAKCVIPFASFVRFANTLNAYLNDAVNTPDMVLRHTKGHPFECLFLRPMETVLLDSPSSQDEASLAFWREAFAGAMQSATPYSRSHDVTQMEPLFAKLITRLKDKNSFALIHLLSRVPFLGAFAPVTVQMVDTGERLRVDIPRERLELTEQPADLAMHSESFAFMLQNSFGFDTLTVNGTFEELRPGGFERLAKNFAIENLNNLGYYLTPALAMNMSLIALSFRRLIGVTKKLRAGAKASRAP